MTFLLVLIASEESSTNGTIFSSLSNSGKDSDVSAKCVLRTIIKNMHMYFFVLFGLAVSRVNSAPRSRDRGRLTTFDQKQTGDYNVQLHLKDFQIVALLNDDSLSAFGVSN